MLFDPRSPPPPGDVAKLWLPPPKWTKTALASMKYRGANKMISLILDRNQYANPDGLATVKKTIRNVTTKISPASIQERESASGIPTTRTLAAKPAIAAIVPQDHSTCRIRVNR